MEPSASAPRYSGVAGCFPLALGRGDRGEGEYLPLNARSIRQVKIIPLTPCPLAPGRGEKKGGSLREPPRCTSDASSLRLQRRGDAGRGHRQVTQRFAGE